MEENAAIRTREGVLQIGETTIFPNNQLIQYWAFRKGEESEAALAHYIAEVAEKNGLGANEIMQIFPLVLRMLRSESLWAGNKKQ